MKKITYSTPTPAGIPGLWSEICEEPCPDRGGDFIRNYAAHCRVIREYIDSQLRQLKMPHYDTQRELDLLECVTEELVTYAALFKEQFSVARLDAPLRRMLKRIIRQNATCHLIVTRWHYEVFERQYQLCSVVDEYVATGFKNFRIASAI